MKFGETIKSLRMCQKKTLREFCIENDEDPSKWSRFERGVIPPPESQERVYEIAKELGLNKDGEIKLWKIADKERREWIPRKVSDEELVKYLPMHFTGKKDDGSIGTVIPSRKQLKDFAELIRADLEGREL